MWWDEGREEGVINAAQGVAQLWRGARVDWRSWWETGNVSQGRNGVHARIGLWREGAEVTCVMWGKLLVLSGGNYVC